MYFYFIRIYSIQSRAYYQDDDFSHIIIREGQPSFILNINSAFWHFQEPSWRYPYTILHILTSYSSRWCFTSPSPKYSWMRYTLLRITHLLLLIETSYGSAKEAMLAKLKSIISRSRTTTKKKNNNKTIHQCKLP